MKNYYLLVKGIKVEVTETIYKEYWSETNREHYLTRLDREHHLLHFSDYDKPDDMYINHITDNKLGVEEHLIAKERITCLHQALAKLDKEDYQLIHALYYQGKSLRKVAKVLGVSKTAVVKKRNKILKKLKGLLMKQ